MKKKYTEAEICAALLREAMLLREIAKRTSSKIEYAALNDHAAALHTFARDIQTHLVADNAQANQKRVQS